MPTCSVFWCKKRSEISSLQKDGTSYHLFPKEPGIRAAWVKACGNHNMWEPKRLSTVCSDHFESSCFISKEQTKNKRKLNPNAVPTLKLFKEGTSEFKSETDSSTVKRRKIETFDSPQKVVTQECRTSKIEPSPTELQIQECRIGYVQPSSSGLQCFQICDTDKNQTNLSKVFNTTLKNPQLEDTPRKKKLRKIIQIKNKQIKRLQSQKRYLKKKIAGLQEILKSLTEKSLINKEELQVLESWLRPQN